MTMGMHGQGNRALVKAGARQRATKEFSKNAESFRVSANDREGDRKTTLTRPNYRTKLPVKCSTSCTNSLPHSKTTTPLSYDVTTRKVIDLNKICCHGVEGSIGEAPVRITK